MNTWQGDPDLEVRLRSAFGSGELPGAPRRLAEALDRVPDAPVAIRGRDAGGRRRRTTFGLLGLAAVLLVGGGLALSGGGVLPRPGPSAAPAIGTRITYRVVWTAAVPASAETLATEVAAVRTRIDGTGTAGTAVDSDGADTIVVTLPEGFDAAAVRAIIGQSGRVAFVPLGDTQVEKGDAIDPATYPELFANDGLADARVATDQSNARVIELTLTRLGTTLFGAYTASHVGSFFAITLDDRVISAPRIMSAIPDGEVQISQGGSPGGWDAAEAAQLVAVLRAPLPAALVEVSVEPRPVGPSASPVATPPAVPAEASAEPSASPIAGDPTIQCGEALTTTNRQIDCLSAINAALAALHPGQRQLATVMFAHECFDEHHPRAALDCAVEAFGVVRVTFLDGSPAVTIGVRFGAGERLEAVILAVQLPSGDEPGPSPATFEVPVSYAIDPICGTDTYRSFTIHLGPGAAQPIWASTDVRPRIGVIWTVADRGLVGPPPMIVDADGHVIVVDGTVVDIPRAGDPMLADRTVCAAEDIIVVARPSSP